MSKSKGNGVDPVDIIDTHGADALRFTLTTMATETQDVRMPVKKLPDGKNTSDKFDFGRNFCTKLWNASRFVLSGLATSVASENAAPLTLTLADDWIISRFNRAVEESNAALKIYRFDQYAKTCYDFFWRDFCDWYVEAAKPALRKNRRRSNRGYSRRRSRRRIAADAPDDSVHHRNNLVETKRCPPAARIARQTRLPTQRSFN